MKPRKPKPFIDIWKPKIPKPNPFLKTKLSTKLTKFPRFVQPVSLKIYTARTTKEKKLIDKKPFIDSDKDGVINFFDCKPSKKAFQDFTPWKARPPKKGREWKKPDEMVAAERFGGANIKRLKKLGQGGERTVYELDRDKVLKIAKVPRGVSQNLLESNLGGYLEQIKHYETGKDYVVMEKAQPLSPKLKKEVSKFKDQLKVEVEKIKKDRGVAFHPDDRRLAAVRVMEKAKEKGIVTIEPGDLMNYDFLPEEILDRKQWGMKDGKAVLIDPGGLQKDIIQGEPARVTELRNVARSDGSTRYSMIFNKMTPENARIILGEWEDIKSERRRFRTKGEKPEKKFATITEQLESRGEDIAPLSDEIKANEVKADEVESYKLSKQEEEFIKDYAHEKASSLKYPKEIEPWFEPKEIKETESSESKGVSNDEEAP